MSHFLRSAPGFWATAFNENKASAVDRRVRARVASGNRMLRPVCAQLGRTSGTRLLVPSRSEARVGGGVNERQGFMREKDGPASETLGWIWGEDAGPKPALFKRPAGLKTGRFRCNPSGLKGTVHLDTHGGALRIRSMPLHPESGKEDEAAFGPPRF